MAKHLYVATFTHPITKEHRTLKLTLGAADDNGGREDEVKKMLSQRASMARVTDLNVVDAGELRGTDRKRSAQVLGQMGSRGTTARHSIVSRAELQPAAQPQ